MIDKIKKFGKVLEALTELALKIGTFAAVTGMVVNMIVNMIKDMFR